MKKTDKLLGTGSFGDVWLAQYEYVDVAMKIPKFQSYNEKDREECEREIKVMSKCNSSYVVKLRGTCFHENYFIVMEYMSNGDLQKYLEKMKDKKSESPLKLRYRMACQIVKGVSYLHSYSINIVHSDIKSSNILLDEYYNAKISDFGISKIRSTTLGTIGPNKGGTVKWLAPEVENDAKPTTKETDIFSVGFTLWELMSFEIPFSKCTNKEYLYKITYGSKKEEIPEGTPPVLKECIERCWEKDPILRPTAIELVEKLQQECKISHSWQLFSVSVP
uniref:Protein kinase domain-containing protein n=1 Tax=Arcella intermedia TaxID=1963864 RepID=A0A6B2LD47_9EUKA